MKKRRLAYQRVCLKLSGEVLGGRKMGINWVRTQRLASRLALIHRLGVDLVIVMGGGNWFRGRWVRNWSLDPAVADYIGMLGTVMNGLALQEALEEKKVATRLMSSIQIHQVAEPYIRRKALSHLKKKRIVILAAGVGAPFFTTDTAAALRALELNCQVVLKGSNVDGVYSADPRKSKKAERFSQLDFEEVIKRNLKVMDGSAFALCRDRGLPIIVFSWKKKESLKRIIFGEKEGTLVTD